MALALALGLSGVASASSSARMAELVQVDGTTPIRTAGSATPFVIKLPTGAACPGDTAHKYYLVNSYVVPISTDPGTLTFEGGVPPGDTTIVSTSGVPYTAQDTIEYTGGIAPLPAFSWAGYAHHPDGRLVPGTYNVGLACANREGKATTYWNAKITVQASSTDSGGFTWSVIGAPKARSGGSQAGTIIGFVIAVVIFGGVAALLWGRRSKAAVRSRTA
jgi:hypothetical protein